MPLPPLLLGIEIGGTKLQLGLGYGDKQILAVERRTIVAEAGAEGVRAQIVEAVDPLFEQVRTKHDRAALRAVGIGFGGPVDAARGIVTKSFQIAGWDGFPLGQWARDTFKVAAVSVHNDADTAGLAEAKYGSGIGFSPILYVTIGSGIGGGLIINGEIYRGAGAGALEIGHLWVFDRSGSDLGVVTLQDAASGWGIAESARAYARKLISEGDGKTWSVLEKVSGNPEAITTKDLAEAAKEGDREALLLLDKATNAMAHGLSQAVTLLAPHRIILGGGVSLIAEALWFAPIRRKLKACVYPPFSETYDIVAAVLGEEVVVYGALALAKALV